MEKIYYRCFYILLKVSLEPLGNRKVCTPKKTGRSQTVFRANRQNVRRQRSCSRSEFVNLLQSENALTMMRQAKSDLRSKFPDQEGSQSLRQSLKVFAKFIFIQKTSTTILSLRFLSLRFYTSANHRHSYYFAFIFFRFIHIFVCCVHHQLNSVKLVYLACTGVIVNGNNVC